jgi:hypothetical protein
MLSFLGNPPRLGAGSHFAAIDDVIRGALEDIRADSPPGAVAVVTDLRLTDVTKRTARRVGVTAGLDHPRAPERPGKHFKKKEIRPWRSDFPSPPVGVFDSWQPC